MNEEMQDLMAAAPTDSVEQSSKDRGGGVAEDPTHAGAGRRKLAWSRPTVTILHLSGQTRSTPYPYNFPTPESATYVWVNTS